MNILLVDDDTELTALLTRYLERELFKVTAVHTAEEGLAEALSARYQAVVLDVMLPGGSGIDILGQIRTRSDVPVLMLTAKAMKWIASKVWRLAQTTIFLSRVILVNCRHGCDPFCDVVVRQMSSLQRWKLKIW